MRNNKTIHGDEYQLETTDEYRMKRRFSFFPWIVMSGFNGDFHWTGKWFTFVTVKQQKIRIRWTSFNEYSYQEYWNKWVEEWYVDSIIK